jgi:hypothetical protein
LGRKRNKLGGLEYNIPLNPPSKGDFLRAANWALELLFEFKTGNFLPGEKC